MVKKLPSYRSDQPFHERMGHRYERDRLDLIDPRVRVSSRANDGNEIMGRGQLRCYRRCESAQKWRRRQRRGGQPSTSVAEYGWVASPVKAGLRPPPPAADGLDCAFRRS